MLRFNGINEYGFRQFISNDESEAERSLQNGTVEVGDSIYCIDSEEELCVNLCPVCRQKFFAPLLFFSSEACPFCLPNYRRTPMIDYQGRFATMLIVGIQTDGEQIPLIPLYDASYGTKQIRQ